MWLIKCSYASMYDCGQWQASIIFFLSFQLLPKIPIIPMHGNRIPSSTHRQFRTISCWSISPSLSLDPFLLIICWLSISDKFPTNCVMPLRGSQLWLWSHRRNVSDWTNILSTLLFYTPASLCCSQCIFYYFWSKLLKWRFIQRRTILQSHWNSHS